jgi:cytochrome bd-type quinol oxidase subunit 2
MTSLPIAQVAFGLYVPILVLLAGYALVSVVAGIARNREENERAERLADISFLLVVLGAAYAVVLLIVSAVSYPSRVYDMILIIFVVVLFFGLLLFLFFVISELVPRTLRRRQR